MNIKSTKRRPQPKRHSTGSQQAKTQLLIQTDASGPDFLITAHTCRDPKWRKLTAVTTTLVEEVLKAAFPGKAHLIRGVFGVVGSVQSVDKALADGRIDLTEALELGKRATSTAIAFRNAGRIPQTIGPDDGLRAPLVPARTTLDHSGMALGLLVDLGKEMKSVQQPLSPTRFQTAQRPPIITAQPPGLPSADPVKVLLDQLTTINPLIGAAANFAYTIFDPDTWEGGAGVRSAPPLTGVGGAQVDWQALSARLSRMDQNGEAA